jgi:MarR family transcriptional regulator, 2-MHQ and catechol-resistance regulon repressor
MTGDGEGSAPRNGAPEGKGAGDGEYAAELRLFGALSRTFAVLQERSRRDVARHGLTPHEFAVLEELYRRGRLLLGEIQDRVLVSSGGVTYLVDRLAARGLVERQDCPGDRRARYAALTPEGGEFMDRVFPEHARALAGAMEALTPDERREVTRLLATLRRGAVGSPTPG